MNIKTLFEKMNLSELLEIMADLKTTIEWKQPTLGIPISDIPLDKMSSRTKNALICYSKIRYLNDIEMYSKKEMLSFFGGKKSFTEIENCLKEYGLWYRID